MFEPVSHPMRLSLFACNNHIRSHLVRFDRETFVPLARLHQSMLAFGLVIIE